MSETSRVSRLERSVAGGSIVLSLLFVAYQIQQNTRATTASAIQETASLVAELYLVGAADPDLAALIVRVSAEGVSPAELTAEQNGQVMFFLGAALKVTESRFRQSQLGIISGQPWFGADNNFYRSLYVRVVWPSVRVQQAPDFAEFMDREYELATAR